MSAIIYSLISLSVYVFQVSCTAVAQLDRYYHMDFLCMDKLDLPAMRYWVTNQFSML